MNNGSSTLLSAWLRGLQVSHEHNRTLVQRCTRAVRRAMDCAQTSACVARLVLWRDVLHKFVAPQEELDNLVSPRGSHHSPRTAESSHQHFEDAEGTAWVLDASLRPLAQWIARERLDWSLQVVEGDNAALLWLHWPPVTIERGSGSRLRDYWTQQRTLKCVDESRFSAWYATVRSAMEAGQVSAALITMYRDADYDVARVGDRVVGARDAQSGDPIDEPRFALERQKWAVLLQWCDDHGLRPALRCDATRAAAHFIVEWSQIQPP